jgi:transposase InsO family protein
LEEKMTEFVTIEKAAKLLGANPGTIRRKCIAGKYAGAKKIKGSWMIPITAHDKFRQPDYLAGSDDISHLPAHKRDAALKKLGLSNQFEEYAAQFVRDGGIRTNAIRIFASQNKITRDSLYRWLRAYRMYGLMGLVDSRGSADISEPAFSQDAQTYLLTMYLTPAKLSLKVCYQNLLHLNKKHNYGWQIPGLRSVYNWVESNVPKPVRILHREGQKAYEAQCAPYVQTDLSDVPPGSIWVGDHHQLNFWIRHKNKWTRPWLTAWMDMRSRCIVGWYLCPSPNQTTIMIAMRGGIEKYGPPDAVKIDNGKDYDSQMFTGITKTQRRKGYLDEFLVSGIYGMMNISVSFSIPYHPQSKPIERLFATVGEQFSKTVPTCCGNKPENKPENLNDLLEKQSTIDGAYNFDSLTEVFGQWVEVYNNTVHSGAGMEGRTPSQTMNLRVSKRAISKDILDMLMCVWSGKLTVGKNGVRFKGLLYGQYEPRLLQNFGKAVRVAYNPHDLRQVTVYDAESLQRLCIAEQNQLIKYSKAIDDETLRDATRQKAGVIKAHRNWLDNRGLQHFNLTDLTIKALNDAAVKDDSRTASPTLRPVKTPLDLHLDEHLQEKNQKILRKAVGAEAPRVDIDLSGLTNQPETLREKLKLFEK